MKDRLLHGSQDASGIWSRNSTNSSAPTSISTSVNNRNGTRDERKADYVAVWKGAERLRFSTAVEKYPNTIKFLSG